MTKITRIKKNRGPSAQAGMTYVELIVVLSIFSVMASVIIFNYGDFQAKVDIKNLASDIALKVVEAQKSALSGKFNAGAVAGWKPSYGVYFDKGTDNKSFIYFADLNQDRALANPACSGAGECLDKITITKGNSISAIDKCTSVDCGSSTPIPGPLSISFKRPDSRALFSGVGMAVSDFVQITIKEQAPKTATAKIKIYQSGRIQVN